MDDLLVLPLERHVGVLIPKKRGKGYLRCPVHHSHNDLSRLMDELGYHDICGLNGELVVFIQTFIFNENREEILSSFMPQLSQHFGVPWRIVSEEEYYHNYPLKSEGKPS